MVLSNAERQAADAALPAAERAMAVAIALPRPRPRPQHVCSPQWSSYIAYLWLLHMLLEEAVFTVASYVCLCT